MGRRRLPESWIRCYTRDYIIKQESPPDFHFWMAMTVIAASLRRNVWIDRGIYTLFPNLYMILVARSGSCRKSASMETALDLLKEIGDINIVRGRATVEGLVDSMDRAVVSPDGKVMKDGSIFLQADELSYMFGKASYITDLMSFITAAYTGKASLDFLTRGKGLCKVRNPCPTFVAGTTPEQMGEIFPSISLASGFMGRVLFIYGKKGKKIAKPQLKKSMQEDLIQDLYHISQLHGEIKLNEDAEQRFNHWYENMKDAPSMELDSFYERKHDHILKTAMLLSVSESDNMIIEEKHIEGAIQLIRNIEDDLEDVLHYIGASEQSHISRTVHRLIIANSPKGIDHSYLLRKVYKRLTFGADEFKQIINDLKETGNIKEVITGRTSYYKAVANKDREL